MMKYETSKLAYQATSVHSTMLDKYFRVLNHRWKDRTVIYASNKGRAMLFQKTRTNTRSSTEFYYTANRRDATYQCNLVIRISARILCG